MPRRNKEKVHVVIHGDSDGLIGEPHVYRYEGDAWRSIEGELRSEIAEPYASEEWADEVEELLDAGEVEDALELYNKNVPLYIEHHLVEVE